MFRRILPLLTATAALALPGAAGAATFSDPVTLADWSTDAGSPAAAPGAVAWTQTDGVHLLSASTERTVFGGSASTLRLAVDPDGQPVLAWAGADGPHAWAGGDAVVPSGADARTRAIAVTPFLAAWVGVADGGRKEIQIAQRRRGSSTFGAAQTLPEPGRTSYGLVAAGDATGRAVLAWHSLDETDRRRIVTAPVAADGTVGAATFLTGGDAWDTNPAVAMAPDGTAVIAWLHGKASGRVRAVIRTADGRLGPVQELDTVNGSALPMAAAGSDGSLALAWRGAGGKVLASVRRPGAGPFASGQPLGGENPGVLAVALDDAGTAVVAWTDLHAGDDPNKDGFLAATARAPGATAFSAPVVLADSNVYQDVAAAGDRVLWVERRVDGEDVDSRVRSADLTSATAQGPNTLDPAAGDRIAPKVRVRFLGVRGGRIRMRVVSDETAVARLTTRRARSPRTRLVARRARVLTVRAPRTRHARIVLRVTDAAGNTRTVRRTVRVRPS